MKHSWPGKRKHQHDKGRQQPASKSGSTAAQPAADRGRGVYRTIFLCELIQESGFSTGGDEAPSPVDMGLARESKHQLVYRGHALAGALLATARSFLEIPGEVTRGIDAKDEIAQPGSLWQFDHARPRLQGAPATELRAHAAHLHATRAAASGGYFDIETLPRDARWSFLLEIVHPPTDADTGRKAAAQAALALREWSRGRCWLGRRVARGLGWMRLDQCTVIELPRTQDGVDAWPRASHASVAERHAYIHTLTSTNNIKGASKAFLDDYLSTHAAAAGPQQPRRAYARWSLDIVAGEYRAKDVEGVERSYGLDALSTLGHRGTFPGFQDLAANLITPAPARDAIEKVFSPDTSLAMTTPVNGRPEPLIAGSGIAGAFRHRHARQQRSGGQATRDPVSHEILPDGTATSYQPGQDANSALFGALGAGHTPSRLLFGDGRLVDQNWSAALLEKVALDEFRQSAYESAKFNRLAVLEGHWRSSVVQEIRVGDGESDKNLRVEHIKRAIAPFGDLLVQASARRIGFGGGEFRGYGHLQIGSSRLEWALAGQDWQEGEPGTAESQTPGTEVISV